MKYIVMKNQIIKIWLTPYDKKNQIHEETLLDVNLSN